MINKKSILLAAAWISLILNLVLLCKLILMKESDWLGMVALFGANIFLLGVALPMTKDFFKKD